MFLKEVTVMWTENNYRRVFLDMHVDDWNEEFLSRLDPSAIVATVKESGAQMLVAKCRPHTGLALFPTKYGRQHRGLKGRDYVGEMVELCHKNGMAVKGYFSQIFDNDTYERHPEWRFVDFYGNNSRDRNKKTGWMPRYGLICPNNEEYRKFCRDAVTEILTRYELDSIFLDMPFFTDICYCAACRDKYFRLTGKELPRKIDFRDPETRRFQAIREDWMAEFTAMMREAVKAARPSVTIEQNLSCIMAPWKTATTDAVADVSDYAGGDLYGGYLEESLICKYYRNLSHTLPFVFICSRCDPNLTYHTTTKTKEEFIQHGIIALIHNGALSICDGINPDGTICDDIYREGGAIKEAFAATRPYEPFVNGNYLSNAVLWFNSRSKYDLDNPSDPVVPESARYLSCLKACAGVLRMENIPFDVIPTKKLADLRGDVLIVPNMADVPDVCAEQIENYVRNGGNLYLSGRPGNPRLAEMIGVTVGEPTEHNVTYIAPTEAGKSLFEGFTDRNPLAVTAKQYFCSVAEDVTVLGTTVLPYTAPSDPRFASIHSDPPGIRTSNPAAILRRVGKGTVIWLNAPIESAAPYQSRRLVGRLFRSLCGKLKFETDAPGCVEVMTWEKDGKSYLCAVNQQEQMPLIPISRVSVTVPYAVSAARDPATGKPFETVTDREGRTTVLINDLQVFRMVELIP